ncbi:MAG TPA: hypothetical protein VFG89_06245 [Coriobacteriia bacterium]|nr:hypothetical protein [Coriobacteriia bacterium]
MDEELARYIRGVAARRSASEMLEDDLFLSSLLTDLVVGVQSHKCVPGDRDSLGMTRLRAMHDATAATAAASGGH